MSGSDPLSEGGETFATQPPPEDSYISFSHAVSWIAFRHSVAGPALSNLLGLGSVQTEQKMMQNKIIDAIIMDAVRLLTDLGSDDKIAFRGRYFRDVLGNEFEIDTQPIPAVRLADYRWFDTLDDCLYRGVGLAWGTDRRELLYPKGSDRHFRFVSIRRADLLAEFPIDPEDRSVAGQSSFAARAPAFKTSRPPSDEAICTKADEMKARGIHCSRTIAKMMRFEAGFEQAGTVHVRGVLRGRYPSGRRKKEGR